MKQISNSREDTKAIAKKFTDLLIESGIQEKAVVVALNGDLGSAKTTFSQFVGEVLGVREGIQSPTFLIEKIYELFDKPWKHLIHIDTYRLEKPEELLHLGWQEIISRPDNLILVEWADKVKDILPNDAVRINFKFLDENVREIEISLLRQGYGEQV